jgi:rfaE bifunctional protein kinase chain/domain
MVSAMSVVARFPAARVVVLGDLVADEYVHGETERVSREAPVLVVRYESAETKLGGAANAAANVAALGGHAIPVGVIGSDATGRRLREQFLAVGAEVDGLLVTRGRCTETKTRILAGGRSTTRQQMLRLDRSADRPLRRSERAQLQERLLRTCANAGALVVSDYGSGLIDAALAEVIRGLSAKLPVCVDSRYAIASFRGVTLAKPNEPELEAAIGRRLTTDADLEDAGQALLRKLEVRALVVTRGRRGMSLFQPSNATVQIPVWGPAEAVDVTGAGDTVLATLALALASGADFEEAARLANVAGGIVVQKPGTATCTLAELSAALEQQDAATKPATRGRRVAAARRAARRKKG